MSGNFTILIQHNTNVKCVRNIIYCLNINAVSHRCEVSNDLNDFRLTLEDSWNPTFVNLSIVYDIIYAKYRFTFIIEQFTGEIKKYS